MAERIFNVAYFRLTAVFIKNLNGVRIGRIVYVVERFGERRVFGDGHLIAQRIDARIGRGFSLVMIGIQIAVNEPDGDDVLQEMIAVGRIMQRAFLGDLIDTVLMRGDIDAFNVIQPF